ncbi:hypothetical protein Cgig2_019930 [Carnegiea gigantea]|uniref:Uncharacterized protein n=1 Tax=Carnegiea gigantea TaxID=171969 RepID=A0A9Q1QJC0_9CARY|nr:hypothetical protein Cgig2_019930 [Carnegiea gigantea]
MIHSQGDEKSREVHSQENLNKHAENRPRLEADPSSEKKGKRTIIGTPHCGKEDERFFEVREPSKPLEEDQTSVDGCDQTFFMSSTNGPNSREETSCQTMSIEAVSKGDSMIRDLKMESDKCSTALDTESTPTTYAEDDPIAKVGKVQHDDGKAMPENMIAQVEATKFCIEGDTSSSGSIMRVKEFDHMEDLSIGAYSGIGSNMEFEAHNANPKSVPPDVTSARS